MELFSIRIQRTFQLVSTLPEIELCGFRLAVGGVNRLGAVPKTFAFHLFGLQEVFRHGIGI